jgi:hypothetical protein
MRTWFTPLRTALLCTALDLGWVLQAMAATPRHGGSNVALVSLVVWVVAHLPAAILASGLLKLGGALDGPSLALPAWSYVVLGALGLLQTFGLAWGFSSWLRRAR